MKHRLFLCLLVILTMCSLAVSAYATDDHVSVSVDSGGQILIETPATSASGTTGGSGVGTTYETVISKYKTLAQGVSGICAITALISLLYQITKLGGSGDNEGKRSAALKGILFSGIGLTLFGGLTVVVSFFWGLAK